MKKGMAIAGNMIVDTIYPVDHYPQIGELATIEDNIKKATGGAVCNVIVDLAKLDEALPLTALGVVGADEAGRFIEAYFSDYPNIDYSQIVHEGTTSFTAVMSDISTKQRTFFHFRGANARFSEEHIDWDRLNANLLHVGYILLLDELDRPDREYGTKMARLLASARRKGIKTSVDMVSDRPDRFKKIAPPALKYTDYCIINEIEAERTTGIVIRNNEVIDEAKMDLALTAIKEMGVAEWVVVHAPEGGYGLNCVSDERVKVKSLQLPDGYIKGTNGAGDAFCAGVLYGVYREKPLYEAIELGIACASCSLSEPGATEGMRSYDEVMKLYRMMK